MLKVLAAVLALAAVPTMAGAQTRRVCLSEQENQALMAYVMPSLVERLGDRCRPTLGPDAFLPSRAGDLARTLRDQSRAAWPTARAAAEQVARTAIPGDGVAGRIAEGALGPALANGIADGFDPAGCQVADRLLRELAPLPPRNLVNVMALFLEVGVAENEQVPFRVCRTPPAR